MHKYLEIQKHIINIDSFAGYKTTPHNFYEFLMGEKNKCPL